VADPPTIVIHAGPKGDRGLSALDGAVMVGEPTSWTALQAVQEIDAGPIWPSRNFPRPGGPAAQLILEVITMAADPDFRPEPGDYTRPDVWGAQGTTHRRTDDGQPLHTSGVVDPAPANGRETSAK
jgi:putative two-component system hydrogenase maturation factor HypX/HoxX